MELKAAQSSQTTDWRKSLPESKPSLAPRRSLSQNDLMWPLLRDISRQVQWPVDGELKWLEPEDWKILMVAGLKREQRIAKGIWGGFVALPHPSSRLTKAEFSDLIEIIYAWGAEHGVQWTNEQGQ